MVAAVAENGVIGRDGGLPWRLPDDSKFFRRCTMGKAVLMGRLTFESIGKPLPGRRNIVVTSNTDFEAPGCTVVDSLEAGLAAAADEQEVVIMGGAAFYREGLPLAERLYLTRVHAKVVGDVYFPDLDPTEWRTVESHDHPADDRHAHAFTASILERVG
jgi:dihydrofolate reductase